jgi:hypothetical protein
MRSKPNLEPIRFPMNSIRQKFVLLMLIVSSALMSAPGLGRSIYVAQLHDTEVPSQSLEKFELIEAGIPSHSRRFRLERYSPLKHLRPCFEQQARLFRASFRAARAAHSPNVRGHRLPNGLLAPLRI